MDGAKAQNKIYAGYGKAALRLGLSYDVYRPDSGIVPLKPENKIGTVLVSPTVNWGYTIYRKYDENVWIMVLDGRQVAVGDYIVGQSTFFIAAKQHLLPILGVKCDRKITIRRPLDGGEKGDIGYSAYEAINASTYDIIFEDCPCSMLKGSRGDTNPVKLPTDARSPWFTLYLPNLGEFVKIGDIVVDEFMQEYVVSTNERTELGWRLNTFGLES